MSDRVVKLSIDHLEACAVLYTHVFNNEPWNDGWLLKDARERLTDLFRSQFFWGIGAYTEKDELIGFLMGCSEKWLQGRHFNLIEMCVRTELQRRGIGSQLIASLEDYCTERNINRINLLTVRDGQAEYFYKKNGFSVSPRMIMMSKFLN